VGGKSGCAEAGTELYDGRLHQRALLSHLDQPIDGRCRAYTCGPRLGSVQNRQHPRNQPWISLLGVSDEALLRSFGGVADKQPQDSQSLQTATFALDSGGETHAATLNHDRLDSQYQAAPDPVSTVHWGRVTASRPIFNSLRCNDEFIVLQQPHQKEASSRSTLLDTCRVSDVGVPRRYRARAPIWCNPPFTFLPIV
jgi:hypothetical protein